MAKKQIIPVVDYSTPAGKNHLKSILSLRQKRDEAISVRVAAVVNAIRDNRYQKFS